MGTTYVFFADGFEEMEALSSVDILRRAGLSVQTVSVTQSPTVTGAHGVPVICDIQIQGHDFADAALALLPGGLPGATTLNECEPLKQLLLDMDQAHKPIAAICAAPMVLGGLGLLKGRQATCYPGFDIYLQGAHYTGNMTQTDGHIITGKGPGAAIPFALAVVDYLAGPQKVAELRQAMCLEDN